MITSFQDQNAAMDGLIKLLFKENMVNKQRWEAAAANTKQFLSDHLIPAMGQVSKEACAMHDWMMREQAALTQVELHQLPPCCAHGEVICESLCLDCICSYVQEQQLPQSTKYCRTTRACNIQDSM